MTTSCGIELHVALSSEDFTGKLVEGFIVVQAVFDPPMESEIAPFILISGSFISEESTPFGGEKLRIILGIEQSVDNRRLFVGRI